MTEITKQSNETWSAYENRKTQASREAFRIAKNEAAKKHGCAESELTVCASCQEFVHQKSCHTYAKWANDDQGGCICDTCDTAHNSQ